MKTFNRKLIVGLILLALLSPAGIILPSLFKSDEPWGESSGEKVRKELGYTPKGMQKDEKIWKAPIKDYALGKADKPTWQKFAIYIASGLLGVGLIAIGTLFLYKIYKTNE